MTEAPKCFEIYGRNLLNCGKAVASIASAFPENTLWRLESSFTVLKWNLQGSHVGVLTKCLHNGGLTKWPCSLIPRVRCYHDSIVDGCTESIYCADSVTSSSAQGGDIWWDTSRWIVADCVSSDLTVALDTTNAIPLDKDWTAACGHSKNCLRYTTRNYKIGKKAQHFNKEMITTKKDHKSTRNIIISYSSLTQQNAHSSNVIVID